MPAPKAPSPELAAGTELRKGGAPWGWLMAIAAVSGFSIAPPISRAVIIGGLDPTVMVVARIVLAALLLGGTIAVTTPRLLFADKRCFAIAAGAGLFNAIGMLTFFWALARIEASMASMLVGIGPLMVLSLLALRGERFTYRHGVRLVVALAGIYLLVGPGGQVDLLGVIWVMTAIGLHAIYTVVIQWYLTGYDARTVTFYLLIGMSVGVVAYWWLAGAHWDPPGVQGWMAIIILAVVSTYLSRLLIFGAISRIGSGQTSMLTPVETLLTVIWSVLFLNERLTMVQWAGGALVLTSAVLAIKRLGQARWQPRWRIWARS
jgi:drug/metabolite transporter (DMT)-like permease